MEKIRVKLQFKDKEGKNKTLTVDRPKADLDDQTVKSAMDQMITSKVLANKNGPVVAKAKAYKEIVNQEDYDILDQSEIEE
ncbi:DUF2922 domain-containing protein [Anaerococcus sp. AGMB09787]|uniref:DUF2922 domain-containing protein n=1 Tax=Anaerococcus sp. AGMB09787 TaxID=2922869 RepID=UPI001FAEDA53|nr:DUF2922 domain-containing protein [Anaerococcus sp. AGMB09787]